MRALSLGAGVQSTTPALRAAHGAVGRRPTASIIAVRDRVSGPPYHAFSFAPLAVVAEAYRKAGAEVFNLPPAGAGEAIRE